MADDLPLMSEKSSISRAPAPSSGAAAVPPFEVDTIGQAIKDRFVEAEWDVSFGEITVHIPADLLLEVAEFIRDDKRIACELLADVGGAHWPAEPLEIDRQPSTTGWPIYRLDSKVSVIEVAYIFRSLRIGHWLRVVVAVKDDEAVLPSITGVYPAGNNLEREIYDMFGVTFTGHPNLTRILMPDDWVGHPHRKDYPLGGVDIEYNGGVVIPPLETRQPREVVQ